MPFPETRGKLIDAGYSFVDTKTCKCGAKMELWRTPKNEFIPMHPMSDDDAKAESHFATCPQAAQFRRQKPTAAASRESSPTPPPPSQPSGRAQEASQGNTRSEGHTPSKRVNGPE